MTDDVDNDPRDDRQAGKEKASVADDDRAPDPGDATTGDTGDHNDDTLPQPDLKAAVDFLDAWHGSEPRHLTAIVPDGKSTGRTFAADEREKLIEWCDEQQRRGAGIYYHVNVLNGLPRHGGKAGKAEVHAVRGTHVEIDLKDNFPDLDWQDDNAVAAAIATTLERVKDFPITPTFVVLSGGGVQAGWRFDAPVDGGHMTRIETLNLALALHLGGDKSVRDVSRILRVPGTINFPNAKKRQLGRGSSISSCPILFDNAVNAKTLWQAIPDETRAKAEEKMAADRPPTPEPPPKRDRVEPVNVEAWINGLDEMTLHIVRNTTLAADDRSRMCFNVLLRLIRMNVPDEVAVELRRQYPNGPFSHYTSEKQLRDDIDRAHQYARKKGFEAGAALPTVAPDEPAIPAIAEPRPGDEFPLWELGPRLATVARAVARMTSAPVGLAAMTVLATASLMAQQHIDVLAFHSVRPVSLMTLTVAVSGERKTAVDDLLLKGVRAYERAEVVRLDAEKQKHRIAQQVFEGQVKALARKTSLDAAAREQALAALGKPPTPPPEPGVLIDDATIEGLYRQLKRGRVSQGGLFLGGHAMTDAAILRTLAGFSQIWDRGEFNIVRADVERSHHVWGRRFTIGLMAQPEVARRLTGNKLAKEQGTMSRLLVHWPKSAIGERTHEDLRACETMMIGASDADVVDAVISVFYDNLEMGLTAPIAVDKTGAITCACLSPTAEAVEDLRVFAVAMEKRMRGSEAGRAFNNKAPEHALRIAAVLQMYDAVAENDAVVLPKAVDAEHMRRGIRLAEFFVAEAERLMGHGEVDPETVDAAAVERWLIEKGKTVVTMIELSQYGRGGLRSVRKIRAATRVLVENGRLRVRKDGADFAGRRRREAWDVVPDDHA
jgi:hypothetical protein